MFRSVTVRSQSFVLVVCSYDGHAYAYVKMAGGKRRRNFVKRAAIILCIALLARRKRNQRKKTRRRSTWVRPVLQQHVEQGEFHNLLQELRLSDRDGHFRYLRMSKERFDHLLAQVSNAEV